MLLATVILLAGYYCCGHAQQLPENVCSSYFNYLQEGTMWYAELNFNNLQLGTNRVDVRFSQRGVHTQNEIGALLPYPDESTVRESIGRGRPVKFRIAIWDQSATLPKLTQLMLNGMTLCSASDYPPSRTYFNRFFEIEVMRGFSISNFMQTNQVDPEVPYLYSDGSGSRQSHALAPICCDTAFNSMIGSQRTLRKYNYQFAQPPATSPIAFNFTLPQRVPSQTPTSSFVSPQSVPRPAPTLFSPPVSAPAPIPTVAPISPQPRLNLLPNPTPSTIQTGSIECGLEGSFSPFIHGGENIPRGRFPWLAAVYHKDSFNLGFKCGGSLVSQRTVITAAHCIHTKSANQLLISVGNHDIFSFTEEFAVTHEVEHVRTHPQYNVRTFSDADLGVVLLKLPVTYTTYIRPICLWDSNQPKVLPAGEHGFIAGWGQDEKGNPQTRYPKVVEAAIVSEAECLRSLEVRDLTTNRTLCAGNRDGSGPCMGDSGGGLMMKHNNRWVLRGIVSLGQRKEQQCDLSQYVIYCDLAWHLEWVQKNMI